MVLENHYYFISYHGPQFRSQLFVTGCPQNIYFIGLRICHSNPFSNMEHKKPNKIDVFKIKYKIKVLKKYLTTPEITHSL